MTARILAPGQSYRGWKARYETAQDRNAERQSEERKMIRKASGDLKHLNRLKDAIPIAIERRDNLKASLGQMRSKMLVYDDHAIQHHRPHPGAMELTFEIASTERIVIAAEAAVVDAQARYDNEAAQQRADREKAEATTDDVAEPVMAPKTRTKH